MGKKYIIDLNPDCVEGEYLRIPARIAGEQQWLMTKAALTPYTEPDLEQVRKEAYEQGYYIGYSKYLNRSYEDGLKDAWETARKIAELDTDEQKKLFGCFGISFVAHEFSAHEAIEKIRQYEQEQEEIKVGDEVDWNGDRYVVTYIDVDETYVDVIDCSCGSVCDRLAIKGITKTGRHFPEIATVLEKMRGEQE